MVFNTKTMPGDNDAQKMAIRRAMAYLIDRPSIAKNVYEGTVDPLYSMVPKGLDGATPDYQTVYGTAPDKAKAAAELTKAGVKTPVNVQIWWTPAHYGSLSERRVHSRSSASSRRAGCSRSTCSRAEWDAYSKAYPTDKYPVYELGWFPDYPDTDDYVGEFYGPTPFFKNHYTNTAIDSCCSTRRPAPTPPSGRADFKAIQDAAAPDAPTIPVWQGKQIAVQYGNVTGLSKHPAAGLHLPVLGARQVLTSIDSAVPGRRRPSRHPRCHPGCLWSDPDG